MKRVVTLIQRESMKRTPVRTGNLRGSHRTMVYGDGAKSMTGVVQLTANYAIYVHEAPPTTHFRSPWPKGRKFMERAIKDNLAEIREIIRTAL